MTESDPGRGSADRRQHEHRMEKWSREWIASGTWQLAEPDAEVMETIDVAGNNSGLRDGADE